MWFRKKICNFPGYCRIARFKLGIDINDNSIKSILQLMKDYRSTIERFYYE